MSDEDDEDEKPARRRPALSRSRKLGSRRRGRRDEEDEAEEEESSPEETSSSVEAPELTVEPFDAPDDTIPVSRIPSMGGPGANLADEDGVPNAEKWSKVRGAAHRWGLDFSKYVVGLGQSAHQQGKDFNKKVVRPFSHALFEAAISIVLIFVCGVFGVLFGGYLKNLTAEGGNTVSFQDREVRPGQKIDDSFFSQGFDTAELHKRANRILEDHLKALRASEFVEAYTFLSPSWKEQLRYETFESGYSNTKILAYEIGKVETLDPKRIRLRAEIKVAENGQEKIYQAVYIAILTSEGWRLDGGTFQ